MNFLKNLIGGQIVKGYSISGQSITGVGHHKQWKLYKGKKDSTGAQVSIFVIQKKLIKSSIREQLIKSVKKQVSSLAKIRHPGILALIQPLNQDQQFLTFVTQRVQGNLSSLIRLKKLQQFISSQLQLKLSLFPLLETVNFLHEIVKLCHLGLSLESIYITHDGKWKIGGMNYVHVLTGEDEQTLQGAQVFYDYLHLAPQVVNQSKFNKYSDSYSLGIMFINFMLLLKKTPHSLMQQTQNKQAYNKHSKSYRDYAQFPAILQSNAPQELIQLLSQLLIDQPLYRLNVPSLQSSKWINDPIVLTVKYLQKIANYENKQQVQFLKGLAGVIDKFSGKILHKRIIPILTNLLKFNHLVASIIFILLDIMKRNMISVEEWRKTVWTELKPITQGKQMTAQSLYLLISNMEILQKFLTEENFMACIIPLYLKCFDCPPKIKLLALKHIQRLTKKYDYQFTKTKIVPKLVNTMKDDKIEIRKDALKALYAIINRLDPLTIVNVVLTGLQNCRKAGADQFISSITVQIYNKITSNMSAQILATKIMPGLMPYLNDPSIQRQQFGMYKNALLKMISKIQDQRKKTWSQQQNSHISSTAQKFTQKDFALDKVETQASGSTGKVIVQSKARFDFLNQYKSMGSSYTNNQQRSNENISVPNPNQQQQPTQSQYVSAVNNNNNNISTGIKQQQQSDFSFGIQLPTTFNQQQPLTTIPKQQQSNNEQIIITDHSSFGNFDKSSSYDMGFGNNNFTNYKVDSGFGQNQYSFGQSPTVVEQKPVEYKSPSAFDFNIGGNDNNFGFNNVESKPAAKKQVKQMPFSPSTSPQVIVPVTKPIIKGPVDSGSKKLVGPGHAGLKKPPKYNQFNMPVQEQAQSQSYQSDNFGFTSSFNTNFTTNQTQSNITSLFTQPNVPVNKKPFDLGVKSSDDPFAQVEQQYGISPNIDNANVENNFSTSNNNLGFGNVTSNAIKPKSNDPFDDLL